MSDIVKRLRAYARDLGGWHNIDETCENAADEIERLAAENARMRETEPTPAMTDAGALALVKHDPYFHSHEEIVKAIWKAMRDAARAALAEQEK